MTLFRKLNPVRHQPLFLSDTMIQEKITNKHGPHTLRFMQLGNTRKNISMKKFG